MNRRRLIILVLLLLSLTSSALAQNGVQFRNWKPSLNDGAAVKPKRDCGSLVELTGYEFSIETATLVPASGELPEYCHITGQILPEVRFELSLPAYLEQPLLYVREWWVCGRAAHGDGTRQYSQHDSQGQLRRRSD